MAFKIQTIDYRPKTQDLMWSLVLVLSFNLFLPIKFGLGVLAGALTGIVNFYWLASTVGKSLKISRDRVRHFIAARYWIRFSVIAIIIFYLISRDIVNPLAFILGFTLIMLNIFLMLFVKREGF